MSNRSMGSRLIENGPGIRSCGGEHYRSLSSVGLWSSMTRASMFGTVRALNRDRMEQIPDPVDGANNFGGPVWYRRRNDSRWEYQPRPTDRPEQWKIATNNHGFNDNCRGLGLKDLVLAISEKREPRASGHLAFHVLGSNTGFRI